MKDKIEELITDLFKINEHKEYKFKTVCGFTFVFKQTIFELNERTSSAEIAPVGIIFEENDEIYFAPLDEVTEIEPIVKEFVMDCLK